LPKVPIATARLAAGTPAAACLFMLRIAVVSLELVTLNLAGGRAIAAAQNLRVLSGGGKSELRRAVCRITSGTDGSSHPDGQCNRKHTASPAQARKVRVKGCGKSAPGFVRTKSHGKPHTEQDQIGRD